MIDDELYGYVKRVLGGIDFSVDTLMRSMEVIGKVAHSGRSFLTERHTKQRLRGEHWVPSVMDRRRYEVYEQMGKGGMVEFAKEKAKRILEEHRPLPLPEGAQDRIDAIVEKAQNRK